MAFQPSKQIYSGKIREVALGVGDKAVTVGGKTAYAFHSFEGEMGRAPRVAMEVWDKDPAADWSDSATAPFKGVMGDPAAWAKKCVQEFGADLIVVQTKSADPNAENKGAAEVAEVVKKVVAAVDVPVVVWGWPIMRKMLSSCVWWPNKAPESALVFPPSRRGTTNKSARRPWATSTPLSLRLPLM